MACSVCDIEHCVALESGVKRIATGSLFIESFFFLNRVHSVNVYEMAAHCSGGYNIQNQKSVMIEPCIKNG